MRSEWRALLVIYQGEFMSVRRNMDWNDWIIVCWEELCHLKFGYCDTILGGVKLCIKGFKVWYLVWNIRKDVICEVWRLTVLFFLNTLFFSGRRLLKMWPKYLTWFVWGRKLLYSLTGGQLYGRREKVMKLDLAVFILIFHLVNH